jgi:hypothetical protein
MLGWVLPTLLGESMVPNPEGANTTARVLTDSMDAGTNSVECTYHIKVAAAMPTPSVRVPGSTTIKTYF